MSMEKRIYLTIAIVSFLTILMVGFVIFPLFDQIKDNSKELISQKKMSLELETKIANLEKFKDIHIDLQYFLNQVDDLFVDSRVPIEFISFLEGASQEFQIESEILSVSEKRIEKDFWPHLTFQVVSSGFFPDFLKFLEKIENGPYLIELQNMTVNKLPQRDDFNLANIRVAFSLKVFAK